MTAVASATAPPVFWPITGDSEPPPPAELLFLPPLEGVPCACIHSTTHGLARVYDLHPAVAFFGPPEASHEMPFPGAESGLSAVSGIPGVDILIYGSRDGGVSLLHVLNPSLGPAGGPGVSYIHIQLKNPGGMVTCFCSAAEQGIILAGTADGLLLAWAMASLCLIADFRVSSAELTSICLDRSTAYIAGSLCLFLSDSCGLIHRLSLTLSEGTVGIRDHEQIPVHLGPVARVLSWSTWLFSFGGTRLSVVELLPDGPPRLQLYDFLEPIVAICQTRDGLLASFADKAIRCFGFA